jgi:single-strand DNA-binding protein
MNKVILMGRLTRDPEVRYSQGDASTAIARFSLAVDRRFKREGEDQTADFINCVAWRQTAEFISKYFRKGSALCVTGSIQTRSWQDQQGQRRYATDVVVDEAMFVDSRNEGTNAQGNSYVPDAYNATPSFSSNQGAAPNFEELNTDDDLPF